ncbi:MAG: hypothetical protein SAL07_10205 [Oscillatoria sp. PMC 1051.18]|nr:hypothetical protein [Oscillatoria sp. PMC 1050.18]MEC5030274.1 hypothetical protein [Oscillatoria sp. PMC 1051.18]
MLKRQIIAKVGLAAILSLGATEAAIALPDVSTPDRQFISQLENGETMTIEGEIEEIVGNIVRIRTEDGDLKDIRISKLDQIELGLRREMDVAFTVRGMEEDGEMVYAAQEVTLAGRSAVRVSESSSAALEARMRTRAAETRVETQQQTGTVRQRVVIEEEIRVRQRTTVPEVREQVEVREEVEEVREVREERQQVQPAIRALW